MVAEGAYAHQVIMELWHNMGSCGWEGGKADIERRRGVMGRATCSSFKELVRTWVEIFAGDVVGELVDAGASIGYCGILGGKEGVWGGDTGRGSRTRFRS